MRRPLLLFLLVLLAACRPAPDSEPRREATVAPRPNVKVLTGDDLVIDGEHIQVVGVVTPQPPPRARCWAEAAAAKQVRLAVKAMAESATNITITRTGTKDPQGRTVAQVAFDGVDLGDYLFHEGSAARPQGEAPFRWCEPITRERNGAPNVLDLLTPVG
jgi:endonuclease YncB( thermonuclease family)